MRALLTISTLILAASTAFAGSDISGSLPTAQAQAYGDFAKQNKNMKPSLFEAIGPIVDGSTQFSGTFEASPLSPISNCGIKELAHKSFYITVDQDGKITEEKVGYFDNDDCD